MYLRLASAPADDIGLPPKVEIELAPKLSMMSALATTPPMAMPFPTPLANVRMSGVTPCASYPQKCSPVRPQPVWTSSEMSRIPCWLSTFCIGPKKPSGGVANPPTP